MPLALDGSNSNHSSGVTSLAVSLTTANSGDLIVVDVGANGGPVTGVSSPTLGAFTRRCTNGAGQSMERWFVIASPVLLSESITVVQTGSNFMNIVAYGISGANIVSPWQVASVTNAASPSDPISITPTGAGMVLGGFRQNATSAPTAGAGFTGIALSAGSFGISEYKIVASAGLVSVTLGTGVGDSIGSVGDVVALGGTATQPVGAPMYWI